MFWISFPPSEHYVTEIIVDKVHIIEYNNHTIHHNYSERGVIMASSVMQVRIDDELKSQASAVYNELGLDLPTAIRMFLKRSVVVGGVPFSMTLPRRDYKAERAVRAMQSLSDAAQKNGTADMTLDEINAEIAATRTDRAARD